MKRLSLLMVPLLILLLMVSSCQRVSSPPTVGELQELKLSNLKGIPLEYGSLISVTTHELWPGWAQLWFEDDDRTIRMVRIGFDNNKVHEQVLVIPKQ